MTARRSAEIEAGLCALCRHARVIRSDRGSVFYQCRRAATDPDYPAYPRLPMLHCKGFERAPAEPGGDTPSRLDT